LTFSQIALGLAGFSAILIALSGSPHQWTAVDSYRIKNMLSFSFQAIFLALVPVLLTLFSVPESVLWRVSLLVLCAGTSAGVLLIFIGYWRLSRPDRLVLSPPLVYTVCTLVGTAALIELISGIGDWAAGPGIFFAGLLVMLGVSCYLIIRFLFARPAGRD
jgi:hypothetical protein